jgi:uncharacterized circularly permuted ATP-grasp superfamily protein
MISELLRDSPPCRVRGLVEERRSKNGAQCEKEGPGLLEAPAFLPYSPNVGEAVFSEFRNTKQCQTYAMGV